MSTAKDLERFEVFRPASALSLLWDQARPSMDVRTLQWFADGASSHVATQAMHLAGWVESLACVVVVDGTVGSFQSKEGVSEQLFSLASQIDGLRGMAVIAKEANFEIRLKLGEFDK
ncbi:hypothetical protein [Rhodoferax sp.]|uniref:hypothetical protein n=1 Tax=Rhodoferax sp. TaxID=50421 RepID=UPI0025EFBA43|nr:hypothetical protein [Rhodoferax sp.]